MLYRILICIVLFLIGISVSCYLIAEKKEKCLDLKDPELNEIADNMRRGIPVNMEDALRVIDVIEQMNNKKK